MAESENIIEYKAGAKVIEETQMFEAMYVVKEGQLEAFRIDENGKKVPLGIIKPGEFIGEMAYFLQKQHSCHVVALTDTVLTRLPRKVLESQLKAAPRWILALIINLSIRLKTANEVLVRNNLQDQKLLDIIRAFETLDK